ncbi:MAG TPA: hypothetical protein GX699_05825 [Firmicutes bacterium]|nr:hypothetical protein [Bacillota bacterium]
MSITIEQAIKKIPVQELSGGINKANQHYFHFHANAPQCLRDKRATLQISLMIGFFLSTFLAKTNSSLYLALLALTVISGSWYFYGSRHVRYYKKATKMLMFGHYNKAWNYFTKLLDSRRLYLEGMPQAYYYLKAKQLYEQHDIKAAEYLLTKVLGLM